MQELLFDLIFLSISYHRREIKIEHIVRFFLIKEKTEGFLRKKPAPSAIACSASSGLSEVLKITTGIFSK